MELPVIELEPLVSESAPRRRPDPVHHRFGRIAVVAAAVGVGMLFGSALHRDATTPPEAQGLAAPEYDTLPPPAARQLSEPLPSRFDNAYDECMRAVGGSADSKERWTAKCRSDAADVLREDRLYAACMLGIGGSADSMERRAGDCRADAAAPSDR